VVAPPRPGLKDALLPRAAPAHPHDRPDLLLETMEQPGAGLGTRRRGAPRRVVEKSLATAWAELQRSPGPTRRRGAGTGCTRACSRTAGQRVDQATRARLNVGPLAKQGGSDTVNVSSYDPATLRQVSGASFRVVIDVGDWDNSRAINTPGQSGDPASPHYRDLAPLWLKGEYFPLLYTRPGSRRPVRAASSSCPQSSRLRRGSGRLRRPAAERRPCASAAPADT
jgi:penicillin amidase